MAWLNPKASITKSSQMIAFSLAEHLLMKSEIHL